MRRSALVILAALVLAGSAAAKTMIVRVSARNWQQLFDRIPFKGTSIGVAGAVPGQGYDLILDESDLALVQGSGLATEVRIPDLEAWKRLVVLDGAYNSYEELTTIMRDFALGHPDICALESIGPTYENRWIYGLKISDNPSIVEDEPEVLFFGQLHGNEWAAGQVCRHLMDTLIRNYSTDPGFQSYINAHQTWVFPVINVDAFTADYPNQYWFRKNFQPFGGGGGTDLNRNFRGGCNGNRFDDWGALVYGSNSAHDPLSEVFMGAYGGWATEVSTLDEFFRRHAFVANISFHTSGEIVVWPFGSGEAPADSAYYTAVATQIAAQMSRLDTGCYGLAPGTTLYPMNGMSEDWMYGWAHAIGGFPSLSFLVELGTEGYQPAADLDKVQTEAFHGAWLLMNKSDSITADLEGMVPRPILAPLDSSVSGQFSVHWTPTRPEQNHPDRWALEELSNLTVVTDDVENGTAAWTLEGFSVSTDQQHSGTHSIYSGAGDNICNYAVTRDPYPVRPGDSLTFWVMYALEQDADIGVVEVSLEGREWFQLDVRYTGSPGDWLRKAYPLEPWAGKSIYIRFRVVNDIRTNWPGMYIDDIWPVPAFAARRMVDSTITDTTCVVVQQSRGRYWYRVRGHNQAWGWGDFGPLEDITVTVGGIAQTPTGPGITEFLNVAPSPFTDPVQVSYALARPGLVKLDVLDASGCVLRPLARAEQQPGVYRLIWDGCDAEGRRLAPGVYFVRLASSVEREALSVTKVVVTR